MWKRVLGLLLVPFYLLSLPFGILVIVFSVLYTLIAIAVGKTYLWHRMRRAGRLISQRQLIERIAAEGGTVIVDSTTLGWGTSRAWWTPDEVRGLATIVPPDEMMGNHPFDRWCHAGYCDAQTGRGLLFGVWNGTKAGQRVAERCENVDRIDIWSGSFGMRGCQICGAHEMDPNVKNCRQCGGPLPEDDPGWPLRPQARSEKDSSA